MITDSVATELKLQGYTGAVGDMELSYLRGKADVSSGAIGDVLKDGYTDVNAATSAIVADAATNGLSQGVPPDALISQVKVLLHMNGVNNGTSFPASKGGTITPQGSVVTKTDVKKFGVSSAYFDGNADYLAFPTISNADASFGTGDFTVEGFAYIPSDPNTGALRYFFGAGVGGITINWYDGGAGASALKMVVTKEGTGIVMLTSGPVIPIGQMFHWAVTRAAGTTRLFIDGIIVVFGADATDYTVTSSGMNIGYNHFGYIDEVRVTKGTARYTSSHAGNVPVIPFADD